MKFSIMVWLLVTASVMAQAQSSGIRTLKDRFKGEEDVHAFKLGGFMARVIFKLVIEEETYKEAVKDIRSIDFITIPKEAFEAQHVSVGGYKKFLEEKGFMNLMEVRDNGDHVTIYMAPDARKHERYLIVADEGSDVTVIEMKGYIDPSKLSGSKITLSKL
jgi:hypothetical protein